MIFGGTITAPTIQLEQADNPLNVVELYSNWIDWGRADFSERGKYPIAFRPVGGDPKTATTSVGKVVFLQPPWTLLLWEGDQELVVQGELYPEGGVGSVFSPTIGDYTALVLLQTPSYSELISVNTGSGLSTEQAQQLSDVDARALLLYRLMGLDPTNPVIVSSEGAGVLRVLIGALGSLLNQTYTETRDGSGNLQSLEVARQ